MKVKMGPLLLYHILATITMVASFDTCNETSDTLSFSNDNADIDFQRIGKPLQILCCASGFDGNIQWYRRLNGTNTPFSPINTNYQFGERHQLLSIEKVSMVDNGTYICEAHNSTNTVNRTFDLHVIDCNRAAGPVHPMIIPPKVKYASLGETITLECQVYYGCVMEMFRDVFWKIDDTVPGTFITGNTSEYTVTSMNGQSGNVTGVRLTIKQVTERTFTNFTCLVEEPTPYHTSFTVQIKEKALVMVLPKWAIIVMAAVATVAILVVVMATLFGSQIMFLLKDHTGCHYSVRSDNKRYDVCVLSSYNNQMGVSQKIYSTLKDEFGYSVYLQYEDAERGRDENTNQMQGLEQSCHCIIYLSEEETVEELFKFSIENALKNHGQSKIIVIYNGCFGKCLSSLESKQQTFLKMCKNVKYPDSADIDSRKGKNFWCSIRRHLPRPKANNIAETEKTSTEQDGERLESSSAEPLIQPLE